MEQNMFSESIPPSLANCQKLQLLNLPSNNLTGTRPKKLFTLSSLTISLSMSNNFLTGSLPSEVGDLVNLAELDVSGNKLSGTIPESPYSFKRLGRDVSRNNLSGKIPDFLGKFRALNHLNLSYNDFEGELPKEGIVSNASGLSVLGNHRLCGGIPQLLLPACLRKKPHSSQGILAPKELEPVESTNGFSMDAMISMGSFGSVYKGTIPTTGKVVAVKPSNVLLDEDIVAHVGDFGLARFLLEASNTQSQSQIMSARLRGSIGYIPPGSMAWDAKFPYWEISIVSEYWC
ncbi:probable LRR receptor-like serine/threonine-protein kinase At3g47570 [Prunus dulcis]|uniref:probable LRR receptor-like serine/threonine-protein kinase At3g47570 n=1 Tax=Prunus dulcis TaxID=3755 RepID=UPI001482734E|nr:probable LRR receptor-like serine/threonine-protein kinase At3g47570 [Prunus dulcis]